MSYRIHTFRQAIIAALLYAMGVSTGIYTPPAQAAVPALTCTPPPAEPEMASLARALEYNLSLIYEYVYYNIDYSPTWGSKKGALGTYLDRRGNGIDQNTLFVELLRQSCISANYRYGSVTIPTAAMANLLGTQNTVAAVSTVLGNGGFSGNIDAQNTTINMVWTEATVNGTTYELDPSFKSYIAFTPIDLGKAMGYSRDSLLSSVAGGASPIPGMPAGVNSAQHFDRGQLTAQLNAYSGNLANYLKTNAPSASTKQVYGGRAITNDYYGSTFPAAGTLYDSLPGSFETVYTLTVSDSADGSNPGLSTNLYASQIAGKRLTLTYNASAQPVLALDGTVLATGAATGVPVQTVNMTVQQPYPAGANFSSWTVHPRIKTGGMYALMLVAGELGRDSLTRHQKAVQRYLNAGQTGEPATGEALTAIGTAYLSQSDRAGQFSGDYFGFVDVRHAAMGIAGKTTSAYVDFPGQTNSFSPFDASMPIDSMRAAAIGINIFNSTLESTAVDQLQKNPAVSTVRMFDYANNDGTGFIEANNANWAQVQPLLQNWDDSSKAIMAGYLQAHPDNGQIFVPQNGARKVGDWTGSGYYQLDSAGNNFNMAYLIAGGYYGGYGTLPSFNDLFSGAYSFDATGQNSLPPPLAHDPIDMRSGGYQYTHPDIDVGNGDFPFRLSFNRSYDSSNVNQSIGMGAGWRNNFMTSAMIDSDSYLAFGDDNPLAAVSSAVTAYVLQGLSNSDNPLLTNTVVASLAASWMMDQLVDNAITLNLDIGTKKFVKIPTVNGPLYVPPPGDASTITVDANTQAITLTDKFKNVYQFDAYGKLAQWHDLNGNNVTLTYNGSGADKTLALVSNNHNAKLSFTYSGNKLTQVSNGNASVSFAYKGEALISSTNQAGKTTAYTYDPFGLLTSIFYPSFPSAAAVTNVYDALGQIKTQTDASGNVWQYLFANGHRSTEVDPSGNDWSLYYDKNGNNIEDIDHVGNHTVFTYDGAGRKVQTTYPAGDSVEVAYDANSNVISQTTNPIPGAVDTVTGQPATPLVESRTYDPIFNKPVTVKNPRGYVTTNTYDTAGNLVQVTQPAVAKPGGATMSPVTKTTYSFGLPTSVTDAEGRVTTYAYDPTTLNLLSKVEDAGAGHLGLTTQYSYDAVGNKLTETDPRGNTVNYQYDALRHLTQVTQPAPFSKSITQYQYDADGQKIAEMHATGDVSDPSRTTTTVYDAGGKVISIVQPDGTSKTATYDSVGRIATETSSSGRQVAYAYDPNSRVIKVTDQVAGNLEPSISRNLGAVVREQRTYYNTGGLATLTDGSGNTLTYYYDGFKRQKQIIYPDNGYELHGLDEAGNELVTVNRSGQLIWFSYDPLNRMDSKAPDNEAQVGFGYDYTGRRMVANSSAGLNFSYGYDSAGRQISEARSDLGATTWTLDANGNRTSLTWPGKPAYTTSMAYDALNRLTDIYEGATSARKQLVHYEYNVLSQRIGSEMTGTFKAADTTIDWTKGGQVALIDNSWTGGNLDFEYSYNTDHQRTGVSISDSSFIPVGLPGNTSSYASNALNQYTAINGAGLAYDTRGNLISGNGWNYSYDTENHLYQATTPGTTANYAYDVMGRRESKTVNGLTTHYVSLGDQEIAEYSATGILQKRFIYGAGLDELVAIVDPSNNHQFALSDALGSVIGLVGDDGIMSEKNAYTAYGTSVSLGNDQSPYLYTGRRYDPETGLYYNRARMYSPVLGRFMQADPIETDGGLNFYAYVRNDPVNATDPMGLKILVNGDPYLYNQAIDYLSADSGMANLIKRLEDSPVIFVINYSKDGEDLYQPAAGLGLQDYSNIYWDPYSALRVTNGGSQTPALGLGHELAHAGASPVDRIVGNAFASGYQNYEEKRVIDEYETPAAINLGEGIRDNHYRVPYTVSSPTSKK
ncbi:RHS repeat-associated core domain-containing protein [Dyella jejuensis]|uniref:RHS repeat-associated core domain-containing protein n=1 Tax=Dyella jejuensis TaxID=1432009 RepID=A0ABW8JFZ4_9GAMM